MMTGRIRIQETLNIPLVDQLRILHVYFDWKCFHWELEEFQFLIFCLDLRMSFGGLGLHQIWIFPLLQRIHYGRINCFHNSYWKEMENPPEVQKTFVSIKRIQYKTTLKTKPTNPAF